MAQDGRRLPKDAPPREAKNRMDVPLRSRRLQLDEDKEPDVVAGAMSDLEYDRRTRPEASQRMHANTLPAGFCAFSRAFAKCELQSRCR